MAVTVKTEKTITITGADVEMFSTMCKLVGCDDARTRLDEQREFAVRKWAREMNSQPSIWDGNVR